VDGRRTLAAPLLAVQIAFTLVLLVSAGLFLRTFARLATLDIGLDREPVLIVEVDTSRVTASPGARLTLFERIREAAARAPGVAATGLSLITPVSGAGWNGPVELPHRPDLPPRSRLTFFNSASPGWFRTYGTSLREGRDFDVRDAHGAPPVAIANETFVERYVTGSPLGQVVRYEQGPNGVKQVMLVGVVEDAVYRSVRDPVPPVLYLPFSQAHHGEPPVRLSLSVRSAAGSPTLLTRDVSQAIMNVDGNLSLTLRPLSVFIDGTLVRERLLATVSGLLAALALLLAAIGLYGVSAYTVSRRRAEIGIRMALGAQSRRLVLTMMRSIVAAVAIGVVAGAALSYWAAQYVATLLYGVDARDPLTFAATAVFLVGVAALGSWVPARRAARIDPVEVLRDD
jgi:predicted permease